MRLGTVSRSSQVKRDLGLSQVVMVRFFCQAVEWGGELKL
jgi:hypothetical protein